MAASITPAPQNQASPQGFTGGDVDAMLSILLAIATIAFYILGGSKIPNLFG